MSESIDSRNDKPISAERRESDPLAPVRKPVWETPKVEDVSEQVMAQPYIRFT